MTVLLVSASNQYVVTVLLDSNSIIYCDSPVGYRKQSIYFGFPAIPNVDSRKQWSIKFILLTRPTLDTRN